METHLRTERERERKKNPMNRQSRRPDMKHFSMVAATEASSIHTSRNSVFAYAEVLPRAYGGRSSLALKRL